MYAFQRAGSYYFEFEWERRRIRRGGFPTKTLARLAGEEERRRLREQRIERLWGVHDPRRPRSAPSLREYVDQVYRVHHLPRLEASTQRTARSQLGKLVEHLGTVKLDALDPAKLDEYTTARLEEVSPAQVAEEILRLSRVVNHARGRGVILAHPFRGWRRPRVTRRDYRIVTPEEERRLTAVKGPMTDWIHLALDTGLRKGELRVLERGWITGSELRILQPKVKRVKVIPLTPRAAAILKRRGCYSETRPRSETWSRPPRPLGQGRTSGIGADHPRYLLGQPDGKPYSLAWIDRHWQRTLGKAGLSGIRFQDLRHTFASRCLDAGGDLAEVGEMLGHKPPYTMTLRYLHVLPEGKKRAIEAMWKRYGAATSVQRLRTPR